MHDLLTAARYYSLPVTHSSRNNSNASSPAADEDFDKNDEDGDHDEDATGGIDIKTSDIEMLRKVAFLAEDGTAGRSILKCRHLDDAPSPETIKDSFSAVVGDAFHVIDRPKVPIRSEHKKLYKVAFRDALLAWDPDKLNDVRAAIKEKDQKTDDEIDMDMYFNPSFWKACIRRRILPPRLLYWRVRAVFVICGPMVDSATNCSLFNKRAWKKANNLLKEILAGYYSDPPGIAFYSIKHDKRGEPMMNAYGFELLYCNRGTNDVESIHKTMLSIFGTWHIGIEMSDCLLRERRHRHNHKCSERRRYGFPRIGHFDTWLIDAIQLIVQRNHGVLLFPEWVNASDYKNTNESFGTIALHNQELADAVNSISIDEDKVKLTPDMQYMCRVMGVKFPFLPVHGTEEFKLYAKIVTQGITDPEIMALEWVNHVDVVKGIFPKLPVHLQNHKERFDRNERARIAFEQATNVRELMTEMNHALCPNTEHQEDVSIEVNSEEPQRNHNRPGYDQCWPLISREPQRSLLPPAASAYNDQFQSHIGGVRISRFPEFVLLDYRGKGKRGKDNSQKGPRKRRHCKLCISSGISDSVALKCMGSHRRKDCERFHIDGTPKQP